jgi:hypothetical protein
MACNPKFDPIAFKADCECLREIREKSAHVIIDHFLSGSTTEVNVEKSAHTDSRTDKEQYEAALQQFFQEKP